MSDKPVKKIGLWNIVGLGVGGAIGSGIFVTLGSAIGMTGRSILPITVICVFYMLLAYWYNLAISGAFIVEGGDYSMKGMLFSPPADRVWWLDQCDLGLWLYRLRPVTDRLPQQPLADSGPVQQTYQRGSADGFLPADHPRQPRRHPVPKYRYDSIDRRPSTLCRSGHPQCQCRPLLQRHL